MDRKNNRSPAVRTEQKRSLQADWKFPLDAARKNFSLSIIRQEIQRKHIRNRPPFAENVLNQLRFQTWQHWAVQGSILLMAVLLVFLLDKNKISGIPSIATCSVFFVFAGNACFSSTVRLFSWHMAELEKTLYLDLKQMVCIQMMEGGIISLAALALLTGFLGEGSENGITAFLLYLLVPFLWSDILYLHMLTHFRSIFSGFRQLASGILCGILALFPAFFEDAYTAEYVPAWGILSAAGLLFLSAEVCMLFQKIETGENICLD